MEVPKPEKRKKKGRKKLLPLPSLIKKADRVFAKWVRTRDKLDLYGNCCTCGNPGNQAGHFVKRSHKKVRWHPDNVHLQCFICNHILGGNEAEYSRFIINTYGLERFNWLLAQKGLCKVTREQVQRVIDAYS
jgi:hypothetical protein